MEEASNSIHSIRKEELSEKVLQSSGKLEDLTKRITTFIKSMEAIVSPEFSQEVLLTDEGEGPGSATATDGPLNTDPGETDSVSRGPLSSRSVEPSSRASSTFKVRQFDEEEETKLKPVDEEIAEGDNVHQIIVTQRKTIEGLNKKLRILENQNSSLKKKGEEASILFKKKNKDMRGLLIQKTNQTKEECDRKILEMVGSNSFRPKIWKL